MWLNAVPPTPAIAPRRKMACAAVLFFGVVEMVEIETKLHSNAAQRVNKSAFTFDALGSVHNSSRGKCWLKNAPAALKMLARYPTLLRFSPCSDAFALKILLADEL